MLNYKLVHTSEISSFESPWPVMKKNHQLHEITGTLIQYSYRVIFIMIHPVLKNNWANWKCVPF